jgi:hypothetical protein
MWFGPHELLVNLELSFQKERNAAQIARDIEDLEASIRDRCPDIQRIFIEARSLREPLERAGGST